MYVCDLVFLLCFFLWYLLLLFIYISCDRVVHNHLQIISCSSSFLSVLAPISCPSSFFRQSFALPCPLFLLPHFLHCDSSFPYHFHCSPPFSYSLHHAPSFLYSLHRDLPSPFSSTMPLHSHIPSIMTFPPCSPPTQQSRKVHGNI